MCALCGVMGADDHWSNPVARPGVYSRGASPLERRREMARRLKIVNAVLGHRRLVLREWQGAHYVLAKSTGATRLFQGLAHLWPEAEALAGADIDPLEPDFLDRLEDRA